MLKRLLILMLLFGVRLCAQKATIEWGSTQQTIQGWGGSTGWTAGYYGLNTLSSAQADAYFSATDGIGLAFIKTSNTPDGSIPDLAWLQAAVARGARVMFSFMSPPASMMSNGQFAPKPATNAYLLPSNYSQYAKYMVTYIQNIQSQGVPIYAVSVQTEPESFAIWKPPSPACGVSRPAIPDCLSYFVANYFGPALATAGLSNIVVAMPEDGGWFNKNFIKTCMNNSNCAKYISLVVSHGYGEANDRDGTGTGYCCATATKPPSAIGTRPVWMTEVNGGLLGANNCSGNLNRFDPSIADAMVWAHNIHDFLVKGGVSAWMYYNLAGTFDTGLLCNDGLTDYHFNAAKRFYAIGNWSKFVRPGWVRMSATDNPERNVYVTCFKDTAEQSFACVVINRNRASKSFTEVFRGATPVSVTAYVTDADHNLAKGSTISLRNGTFSTTLSAQSVTTFWGLIPAPLSCFLPAVLSLHHHAF